MKRITFLLTIISILSSGCKDDCTIKKPSNIPSIDWENYNDVYTVYWNYFGLCEGRQANTGDTISLYGWKTSFHDYFYIAADPKYIKEYSREIIHIGWESNIQKAMAIKLDSSDLTKKCFVKGLVLLPCLTTECSVVDVTILITDPNDIYFE